MHAGRSTAQGCAAGSSATSATGTSTSRSCSIPTTHASIAQAESLNASLVDDALARGGTCTGEHGIGYGKLGYLEREHGDLLPLMRGIKQLFDPNGIMNPGKVVAEA